MPPGQTTTNTTAEPYGPSKPLLKTALHDAMRAYNQGRGANTGSMVVPFSKQTQGGYDNLEAIAGANSNGQGTSKQWQDIISGGGFNKPQQTALDQLTQTSTQAWNPNANPGFQGMLDSALRKTSDSADLRSAAAGRYGSGAHEGVRTRELGDIASSLYSQDFYKNLDRRDAATAALGNLGQAGIGNLSAAYQGLQDPSKTMLGVGAGYEDLYKRTLDDRQRVQNQPWDQISRLIQAGNLGGAYTSNTSTAPGPNPFLQTVGGVATGAGLLGGLGLL